MSEYLETLMEPCGHSEPQADSQLHGVCIFCFRDRGAALCKKLDSVENEVLGALDEYMLDKDCGRWWLARVKRIVRETLKDG